MAGAAEDSNSGASQNGKVRGKARQNSWGWSRAVKGMSQKERESLSDSSVSLGHGEEGCLTWMRDCKKNEQFL
ncbi:hypothetical protein NL676_002019 [Syzygium grande]|nr:hypothetical protein NL676_002019 [Syzygium grande]